MSDAVGLSDDYAVLTAGGLRFYFGYEYTTDDGEWCFVVHRLRLDGSNVANSSQELMRVPQSKLGLRPGTDPVEFLLEGIALWMNTWPAER